MHQNFYQNVFIKPIIPNIIEVMAKTATIFCELKKSEKNTRGNRKLESEATDMSIL